MGGGYFGVKKRSEMYLMNRLLLCFKPLYTRKMFLKPYKFQFSVYRQVFLWKINFVDKKKSINKFVCKLLKSFAFSSKSFTVSLFPVLEDSTVSLFASKPVSKRLAGLVELPTLNKSPDSLKSSNNYDVISVYNSSLNNENLLNVPINSHRNKWHFHAVTSWNRLRSCKLNFFLFSAPIKKNLTRRSFNYKTDILRAFGEREIIGGIWCVGAKSVISSD